MHSQQKVIVGSNCTVNKRFCCNVMGYLIFQGTYLSNKHSTTTIRPTNLSHNTCIMITCITSHKKTGKKKTMNEDNIIVSVIRAPSHRNSTSIKFLSPGNESVVCPQGNEYDSAHKQQVVTAYREFGLDRHSQQPHLHKEQEK